MKRLILWIALFSPVLNQAQDITKDTLTPFSTGASYITDQVCNFRGGINPGYAFLGMVSLEATYDTRKIWSGGTIYVHAANTHGSMPSAELTGDLQVVSNIEAGNHTYFQELWYKHDFSKMSVTAGLQDLNACFANSEYGSLFINSSFGIHPTISGNLSAPIFPLTTPGISAEWKTGNNSKFLAAIHDGSPTDFDRNPYNIRWEHNAGDGLLEIAEFQQTLNIRQKHGLYKIGAFTHNHLLENIIHKQFPDSLKHFIGGLYFVADQLLIEKNNTATGVFVQASVCPTRSCAVQSYIGAGFHLTGFLSKAHNDVLGFAVAHVNLAETAGSETSLELSWQKEIRRHVFIQPDLQYIIQPSGKDSGLKNCLTGLLRIGFTF
ncbi:MAG: hypothetical protein A2W93_00285 [Bacteroidetes bacterium GWF2_43_63]|nr:MAG: hypothetical protein A2W94_13235 [Bacteroidetes bacterium GWE2_42_42]OFY53843.1 MAG: hypothetical protein A2W93_00285 [Bacteroidetes bacterium GWF2_43_63]HBG69801.1 hypothetical protein [Bacteroidales bacterium]HCB61001.1 hypothetical protein [Bacteroidales bacterium]HCY24557.1 hypothetical protein [Bacteroidales bacterium]